MSVELYSENDYALQQWRFVMVKNKVGKCTKLEKCASLPCSKSNKFLPNFNHVFNKDFTFLSGFLNFL